MIVCLFVCLCVANEYLYEEAAAAYWLKFFFFHVSKNCPIVVKAKFLTVVKKKLENFQVYKGIIDGGGKTFFIQNYRFHPKKKKTEPIIFNDCRLDQTQKHAFFFFCCDGKVFLLFSWSFCFVWFFHSIKW